VHQAVAVRRIERVRDLRQHRQCLVRLQHAAAQQDGGQVLAAHHAHRQVQRPVDVARVVHGHDVWVVERGSQP
jgi:hypothetical protein